MFKNKLILYTLVLVLLTIGLVGYLVILDPQDAENYQILMRDVDSSQASTKDRQYSAKQDRKKVQKHILYTQQGQQLHILLDSDNSEIVLQCQDEMTEVVERLNNVRCFMQERLYYEQNKPIQSLRYLEADHAFYHYKNDHFIAEDVKVSRYVVPGHQLVTSVKGLKPNSTGHAESADFFLKDKDIQFNAHNLKAKFYSREAKK